MAIVANNKYRNSNAFEPRSYSFIRGEDVEIDIPYDEDIANLSVLIDITNSSSGCIRIKDYILDVNDTVIPSLLTDKLYGHNKCTVSIKNLSTGRLKIIRIELNEKM